MSEKGLSSLETVKQLIPGGYQVFLSGEKMNHSLPFAHSVFQSKGRSIKSLSHRR